VGGCGQQGVAANRRQIGGSIAAMAWWGIPTARGLGLEPARLTFSQDRTRVQWLVDRQLRAAGRGHHRYAPPPLIADRPEGCAGVAEPGDGGRQVIAHQVQLVTGLFCRMDRDLGGRKSKDEPAAASVDRRPVQGVAQEVPRWLDSRGEEEGC